MSGYLKIENPGVAPPEAFTLLGASTKRGTQLIGQFGSGTKHGVGTLLRHGLQPTIYAGNLCLNFGARMQQMEDHTFHRVCVSYSGRDAEGTHRSNTEDLGYVLEYGAIDWLTVDMAMREFVSNALDRSMQDSGDWAHVSVDVVNESQVRAKSGTTRIFIPMNTDVFRFLENMGKWFLHFSEPELIGETILPKNRRNFGEKATAVIYRRGVRVREVAQSHKPSMFDYNLNNLKIDEARNVDDWNVMYEASRALASAKEAHIAALFQSYIDKRDFWEHEFDAWGLKPNGEENKKIWAAAFQKVCGDSGVLTSKFGEELVSRKGYVPVVVPEAMMQVADAVEGLRTPVKVLSTDEREGRELFDATTDAQAAIDWSWNLITKHSMINGKEKPTVKTFRKVMSGGSQILGFYRDNTVFINTDIATGWSHQLLVTALEECVHHATGATDNSRDFQDFILNLVVHEAKGITT